MKNTKTLREQIIEEYTRCARDPAYFMNKYCYIQHPMRGKVLFKLFPYQEKTLVEYENHKRNIVLKSRQTGISTLTAAYALFLMIFYKDKNILVIATKKDVAKNLITKVRVMYEELPSWMKPQTTEENKLSIRFTNGSQIKAESGKQAGRSEALSLLILDEAAFIEYIDDIWAAAQPTLSTGGKVIAVSTPNGIGNWFHKTWVKAEDDVEDWNPIRIAWQAHPERDQKWRDEQDRILGEEMAAQECDAEFITSGNSVISPSLVKWYSDTYVKEPVERRGVDGNYWIWEYPKYDGSDYMLCADVSRGDSTDYSAFHIIDIVNMVQVAEYKGKVDTKTYGRMLIAAATEYNNALLVIENSNIGWSTIQEVLDIGYNNMFYSVKDFQYIDIEQQMTSKYNAEEKNKVPGFSTTGKTKPLMISKLEDYLSDKDVVIHSSRLIAELYTFVWSGHRATALKGYNDDLVMSFAIGLWIRDTALRYRKERQDLHKAALENISVRKRFDPIYTNRNASKLGFDPYKVKVGNETEDLTWLL